MYFFGNGYAEGSASMTKILGGKGAHLSEMTLLGIPVPPGFTITTNECVHYLNSDKRISQNLKTEVLYNIKKLEKLLNLRFGDRKMPLLFSVRSGAEASMPGMMETVLNLGLNDETVEGLVETSHNERFAYDCYRRFLQMFGSVVLGIEAKLFENLAGTSTSLKQTVQSFKALIREKTGKDFEQDVHQQLWKAIGAVFDSWNLPRAETYRKLNNIPSKLGTACTVQAMVFGNLGENSATGVAFTRNPSTGEKEIFGEFLENAQGEDVVAGLRTPLSLHVMKEKHKACYKKFLSLQSRLEGHYKDMQDIEFTIQNGELFLLQTRTGKRSAQAQIKIAVDMVEEGIIDQKTAVLRVKPEHIDQMLHPRIDPKTKKKKIARGLPASPGAVSGEIVFNPDDALVLKEEGKKCLLVRRETSAEDIHGMNAACGILTTLGGMTSHAAVVARGMGKPCVVGCGELIVDEKKKSLQVGENIYREGDILTIDGSTGDVFEGKVSTIEAESGEEFKTLMAWADHFRSMKVRANADTPQDAYKAREFGAEGIGLCRTEHMFFDEHRILAVREMILSKTQSERKKALEKILPYQKEDFLGIFRAMAPLPVTVRLLDPPLHEFLPHDEKGIKDLAKDLGCEEEEVKRRIASLQEYNPMLGHRGCRLGISYPEIYHVQVQALMEAVCELKKNEGLYVRPEIMIPLISHVKEYEFIEKDIRAICDDILKKNNVSVKYFVGTMIELPRAALTADEIAKKADFFSFGTNDLTQTTFGLSRDDAGSFLFEYVQKNILPENPFISLDKEGVGKLITMATQNGRAANPTLKVGICGEHGGDPASIQFCFENGLDYVSCSPYRVPVARLAAARAALMSS